MFAVRLRLCTIEGFMVGYVGRIQRCTVRTKIRTLVRRRRRCIIDLSETLSEVESGLG